MTVRNIGASICDRLLNMLMKRGEAETLSSKRGL